MGALRLKYRRFSVVAAYNRHGRRMGGTKSGNERHGVEMVERVHDLLNSLWNEMGRPTRGPAFTGACGAIGYYAVYWAIRQVQLRLGWFEVINDKRRFRFSPHSLAAITSPTSRRDLVWKSPARA